MYIIVEALDFDLARQKTLKFPPWLVAFFSVKQQFLLIFSFASPFAEGKIRNYFLFFILFIHIWSYDTWQRVWNC